MKNWMSEFKKMFKEKPVVTITETDENGSKTYEIPQEDLPYVTEVDMEGLVEYMKKEFPNTQEKRTVSPEGKTVVELTIQE